MGDERVGMVLCAGLGTRLRPLTSEVPKAAVPVCGVPLLRYAFSLLAGAGVRRVVVNAHHLAGRIVETACAAAQALGQSVVVSREPIIAGTGGALREARAALEGARAIVLMNGDILFDVDLEAALAAHDAAGALATMVLAPMPEGSGYAAVETDASLVVRRVAGRFGPGGEGLVRWHFTGVHILSPELIDRIPPRPFELDVNRQVYPTLFASGLVRGHLASGYWNDLGTPDRYLAANFDLLAGRVPLARFLGADPWRGCARPSAGLYLDPGAEVEEGAVLLPPALVGQRARIARGAVVGPFVVVGREGRVGPAARVERAVVWEGTVLEPGEELASAVAAGKLRVRASAPGLP